MSKEEKEYYANFRDARVISVIKVEVNEGDGIVGDPVRRVVYLIDPKTGEVIASKGDDRKRQFCGGDQMHEYNQ